MISGKAGDEAILPLDIFYKRTEGYIDDAIARATAAVQNKDTGKRGVSPHDTDNFGIWIDFIAFTNEFIIREPASARLNPSKTPHCQPWLRGS